MDEARRAAAMDPLAPERDGRSSSESEEPSRPGTDRRFFPAERSLSSFRVATWIAEEASTPGLGEGTGTAPAMGRAGEPLPEPGTGGGPASSRARAKAGSAPT